MSPKLNTEKPPEARGTDETAALNEDISLEWQTLRERIGEADLDDRSLWSEPINEDPLAAFRRILNG